MLISIDRYNRWPAVCKYEAETRKTAITIPGTTHNIKRNTPKVSITDKETAFTGNGFRSMCKSFNIKLLYGSVYMHTATGLVKRGKNTERLNEIIPGKQV